VKEKREIEYDVCDDCRRPFGGEVHRFGGGEYCINCWVEPTTDMRMHAEAIYQGLQQEPRDTLKTFMKGLAVLYQGATKAYVVSPVNDMDKAEELALQCGAGGATFIDIFDKGVSLHASVFVEVRYKGKAKPPSKEKTLNLNETGVESLLSDVVKSGARDTVKNVIKMLNQCGYEIVKKEEA